MGSLDTTNKVLNALLFGFSLFVFLAVFFIYKSEAAISQRFAYGLICGLSVLFTVYFVKLTVLWFMKALKK